MSTFTESSFEKDQGRRTFRIVSDYANLPESGLFLSVTGRTTWGGKTTSSNTFIEISVEDLIGMRAVIDAVIESEQSE